MGREGKGKRKRKRERERETQGRTSFRNSFKSRSRCPTTVESCPAGGEFKVYAVEGRQHRRHHSCVTDTATSRKSWSNPFQRWDPKWRRKPNRNHRNHSNILKNNLPLPL